MKRIGFILAGALAAATLLAPPCLATTVEKLSNHELYDRAEMVFHGVCVEVESFYDRHNEIVTQYTFEIREVLKGEAKAGDILSYLQPGGAVGTRGLYIPGAARFEEGEETVAFVARPDTAGAPTFTVGLGQGKFMVSEDPGTGRKSVRRSLQGLQLFDWKTGKVADEATTLKLEEETRGLDDFLAEVRKYGEKKAKGGGR